MTIETARSYTVRVATYNIHKCRGLDQRVRPRRIAQVLGELDADVVALQEVVGRDSPTHEDQARHVAEALGYNSAFGENRRHNGGAYGNLLLSRFPIIGSWNYDITTRDREPRGVLRADVQLANGRVLHLFNVHLGTAYRERGEQARHLVNLGILRNTELAGTRIVLGDFNEWIPGEATRLLAAHFGRTHRSRFARRRTYPCVLPLLRLDHIYFDDSLKLHRLELHRSRKALIASDHLPVVAEFSLQPYRAYASWHNASLPQAAPALSVQPEAARRSLGA